MIEDRTTSQGAALDSRVIFFQLLGEARGVSERSMEQLRALESRFPASFTADILVQLERIQRDPVHERRCSLRLPKTDADIPATVADAADFSDWRVARLVDYSAGGVSLRIDHAVPCGTILLVWFGSITGEQAWIPLHVRHCRIADKCWIIGGEFVDAFHSWPVPE